MAQKVAPLYGRFPFPPIDDFIQRIKQVAGQHLAPAQFSAYLTTHDQESFYGLDYQELLDTYQEHRRRVRTITTSAASPEGSSVNINVRFPKDSEAGEGQFVIVAESTYANRQMRDMLSGMWVPAGPEEDEKRKAIGRLIGLLTQIKLWQEEEEREIAQQIEAEEAEKRRRQAPPPLSSIEDSFHFDDETPTEDIIEMLTDLSAVYFDDAPFHIRMITTDGEPYSNIGLTGLRRVLDKRRNLVLKVFADLKSDSGETMELALSFGPMARKHNAELQVISRYSREIRALVRETLEDSFDYLTTSSSMVHGMFRFDARRFSVEHSIRVIQDVCQDFFNGETPTAFLSTQEGKTYPALPLSQLAKVYHQYQGRISFLLFGVNQTMTGQTFSLMFQFGGGDQPSYGSLSIMWGDERIHQRVQQFLWDNLGLSKYTPQHTRSEQRSAFSSSNSVERKSVFLQNKFRIQPRTCLVFMPLEAYWSDALWMHLQQTLRSIGWDSHRAGALYAQNIVDDTWQAVNEAEVLLADLTYKHPDVFYKLGMAHTLGKKVILITQHARDLPPDFQRFPYVVYDNNIHGLQRLSDRIIDILKLS